ncbi:MAG: FtsH protease activity modulator HflK [Lachnospiraceae bacterium]|nr:FtsH protease activity modulator HflK [Lachnospiraceae bacterium]
MKKSGKVLSTIITVFAVTLILGIAASGIYTVSESEQAVVLTFGKTTGISGPGLHFKIPVIQRAYKVDTTIKGFDVGYTTSNGSGEDPQYTSTPDSMMITADYNFITVDFYVEYRVTDAEKALFSSENPELILKNIAQNSIRTTIGSYTVDSVLTTGKNEIQSNIYTMISKKLDTYDIGIQLVSISMQDAEPPTTEISEAFKAVETAKQGKETAINNANKYRNEQIPAANADADKIVQDAEAEKQRRINEATGQVARFQSEYEEYKKFPAMTKRRMFYETMEDVLPGMKVVILSKDGDTQTLLPLDSFSDSNSSVNNTSGLQSVFDTDKGTDKDTEVTD